MKNILNKIDELDGKEYAPATEAVRSKDYATAGAHFKEAALCGHAVAQYNYGVSLANGEVGDADPLEGAFWYFISAKGGHAKAMINLGLCLQNEEYLRGNAIIGRKLKEAAEELEDESSRAFVVRIAAQLLDILKDDTFNI